MKNSILVGAIDVDDKAFHGSFIQPESGEVFEVISKPTAIDLSKKLDQFKAQGFGLRFCYEATYLGFSLYRKLKELGWNVEIVAPTLIPEMSGARVKTDRLDSRKLARYYLKGLLTVIHVPTEEEEVVRDLIRSRGFLMGQFKALKLHFIFVCRRHGLDYKADFPGCDYWTKKHFDWLAQKLKTKMNAVFLKNIEFLQMTYTHLQQQISFYEAEIQKIAERAPYDKAVKALICYRGLDTLLAMKVITEIGDIKRFPHPRKLTSYAGMDLKEYSSGGKERRFGITKMGNTFLRTAIVEACQPAHYQNQIGVKLKQRRLRCEPSFIEIADRCMKRLYKRSHWLAEKGKHRNKVKVACAREMLSFVWESLRAVA